MIGRRSSAIVADSYFDALAESAQIGRYAATDHTVGPWAPHLQHGGPPNALAVRAAERLVAHETGRTDLVAARIAADFVGPVPVGEVTTRAQVLRTARSAALAEVRVSAQDRDCLLARVWFVRAADTAHLTADANTPVSVPDVPTGLDYDFGYGASLEWRFVRGRMAQPGPAAAWVRPRVALLDGYVLSGLARAALIADSASGISAELDWARWSFRNVDLDIHLARAPRGDWLLMDAATTLGDAGAAVARSTLSDVHGIVGGGLQTLVLSAISTD
jgi:acyl-coenzyme A thioesterase PaaI-like protein